MTIVIFTFAHSVHANPCFQFFSHLKTEKQVVPAPEIQAKQKQRAPIEYRCTLAA
ncbi:hypothetical protein AB4Z17_20660 [Paenibacillus sp. TAF43_2]|uniref:hypothetical protein n=1 Tax=Paenibacillus sp. TAF43_2 TaxID=3233069 RepID=UPI003F9B68B9